MAYSFKLNIPNYCFTKNSLFVPHKQAKLQSFLISPSKAEHVARSFIHSPIGGMSTLSCNAAVIILACKSPKSLSSHCCRVPAQPSKYIEIAHSLAREGTLRLLHSTSVFQNCYNFFNSHKQWIEVPLYTLHFRPGILVNISLNLSDVKWFALAIWIVTFPDNRLNLACQTCSSLLSRIFYGAVFIVEPRLITIRDEMRLSCIFIFISFYFVKSVFVYVWVFFFHSGTSFYTVCQIGPLEQGETLQTFEWTLWFCMCLHSVSLLCCFVSTKTSWSWGTSCTAAEMWRCCGAESQTWLMDACTPWPSGDWQTLSPFR